MISFVASASGIYSASQEDHVTVCCFFDFHDIGTLPRVITNPDVDQRSSESFAQSESVYAVSAASVSVNVRENDFVHFVQFQFVLEQGV